MLVIKPHYHILSKNSYTYIYIYIFTNNKTNAFIHIYMHHTLVFIIYMMRFKKEKKFIIHFQNSFSLRNQIFFFIS